jgi:CRP/FNR family transcriptional regulator, cyclic AMP receptor protein
MSGKRFDGGPLFGPEAWDQLTATGHVSSVSYRAGDVLFTEGDVDCPLLIIVAGRVKVGRADPRHLAGRECLFTVLGPGDIAGEDSFFDPGPRSASATATTDVEAVSVSRDALIPLLRDRPEVTHRLLRLLARRVRRTTDNITDTAYADVAARVAKHLLALAQQFGVQHDGAMRVPMDLNQTEFAHLVGTSRESVNKTLCEFADRGWISVGRHDVLIRESEPLAVRARGGRRTVREARLDSVGS